MGDNKDLEKDISEEALQEQAQQKAEETETAAQNAEVENSETGNSPEEEKKSWTDRKASKKASKIDKEKEALKEQVTGLEDKVKRQLAEFENFRNRSEKEKSSMYDMGAKSILEKILPVVDNFERGLMTVPEDKMDDPFVDGMNKVYRQLISELENIGVKAIAAEGAEFDPNFHNAVMQVENPDLESGTVAQELLKGYTYHDVVIRHSMVSVVS